MKKYSIIIALASLLVGLGLTSCDDYLDVNKNEDAPDRVDGYLYLAGIEEAYQGVYCDIRAIGPLTQMMGTTSYTSFASHYYSPGSDSGGEAWRMVYWNQGMNLENMINQSIEAQNWTLAGIGYAIKAFSWDLLTKINGECVMKQAFETGRTSFDYDYQEDVYPQVREWASTAIKYLEMDDNTVYGTKLSNQDYIYGGDKSKWIKFAYAVIARNLASLSNKKDFKDKYYNDFVDAVNKSFASNADNATVKVKGGGASAAESAYNNFWGPYRGNLSWSYFPTAWAVGLMTGTVPKYDADGNFINVSGTNTYCPYELADEQIICDTLPLTGHYDPRVVLKIGTTDSNSIATIPDVATLRTLKYYGGSFTSQTSPINGGTAPSFYGRNHNTDDDNDGNGRWLYSNDAPYVLMTYPELLFDLAEIQYKYGSKAEALETWKKAVAGDMEFSASYIVPGEVVDGYHHGDKVTAALFNKAAQEYLDGPYVGQMTLDKFSLSHIMLQKFVHLYPWGALEEWVDQRKYFYDISYTGDYPSYGNGWDLSTLNQKMDDDATKVFKGLYLAPAQVQGRKSSYNSNNNGSPCFRLRPRYNSEYMWNLPALRALKPIAGTANDYHCSIPWFAYPGDQPK